MAPSHWGSAGSAFRNPYQPAASFYSMKNDFDSYHYPDSGADPLYNGFPSFPVLQTAAQGYTQTSVQQTGSAFNIVPSNNGFSSNQPTFQPQGQSCFASSKWH